nr:MAG TPA: hypothetical protein [Caudoviricetes sp.]
MVDRFFLLTYNLYVGIHPGVHLRLDAMPRIFSESRRSSDASLYRYPCYERRVMRYRYVSKIF